MNCKRRGKNLSSDQNTGSCGSLALPQKTQETGRSSHFPHSTGHMEALWMKKNHQGLVTDQLGIVIQLSLQFPEKPTWDYGTFWDSTKEWPCWLESSAKKSVWSMWWATQYMMIHMYHMIHNKWFLTLIK